MLFLTYQSAIEYSSGFPATKANKKRRRRHKRSISSDVLSELATEPEPQPQAEPEKEVVAHWVPIVLSQPVISEPSKPSTSIPEQSSATDITSKNEQSAPTDTPASTSAPDTNHTPATSNTDSHEIVIFAAHDRSLSVRCKTGDTADVVRRLWGVYPNGVLRDSHSRAVEIINEDTEHTFEFPQGQGSFFPVLL